MTEETEKYCPVCLDETPARLVEHYKGYRIWECGACRLQFADPLVYSAEAYNKGYGEAQSELSQMADYAEHVRYAQWLTGIPDVGPYLLPLERAALRWLLNNVEKGAPILDLGCGAGRFLLALRQKGFDAFGLEVAEAPVMALQKRGVPVLQGTLADYPCDRPDPAAVVCFEVLEHLSDPVGFLREIGNRFPRARLLLAVPYAASRRRFDGKFRSADYPPNHLTRWQVSALGKALSQCAFEAEIAVVHITADQIPCDLRVIKGLAERLLRPWRRGSGHRTFAARGEVTPGADLGESPLPSVPRYKAFLRWIRRGVFFPYVAILRLLGGSGYWLLAMACPKEK